MKARRIKQLSIESINILVHSVLAIALLHVLFDLGGMVHSVIDLFHPEYSRFDEAFIVIPGMLLLYYLNSQILIPRFLNRRSWYIYLISVISLLIVAVLISGWWFTFFSSRVDHVDMGVSDFYDTVSMFYVMILGLSASYGTSRLALNNEREKQLARESERAIRLEYLAAQIQPHFLFNTLNGINSIAIEEGAERTSESIFQLSDLLRYGLEVGNKKIIPLANEVKVIQDYITLQKLRLGDDYPVIFDVLGDTSDAEIIPFVLINFVENAFKYGVSTNAPQPIEINLLVDSGRISFLVKNAIVSDSDSKAFGVGLANSRERLRLAYGDEFDLTWSDDRGLFEASVTIKKT